MCHNLSRVGVNGWGVVCQALAFETSHPKHAILQAIRSARTTFCRDSQRKGRNGHHHIECKVVALIERSPMEGTVKMDIGPRRETRGTLPIKVKVLEFQTLRRGIHAEPLKMVWKSIGSDGYGSLAGSIVCYGPVLRSTHEKLPVPRLPVNPDSGRV
ncbi:hypothetical protein CR513_46926, partial [Mucuna pruriens]